MIRLKLKLPFVFIAASILFTSAMAQTSRLQQGMDNFSAGNYEKALEYFNLAILQEKSLPAEIVCQAYYYRGLTYVRLHNEAFTGDDKALQKLYNDAILSAYKDYKASLGLDDGKLWKQIDLEIKNLHQPLLEEGLASLNAYNESVFQGKPEPKLLSRAEEFLESAHEIRESYLVCDLLGQVYLDKGQKPEATEYFLKSEKLYTEKLPDEPDFLMAYVFYRLAAIHKPEDVRLAMQDNQRGLNLIESEYTRFVMMRDKMAPARAKQMEEQYRLAIKDLNALKLDLYLSDKDLYVEALHVFEEELEKKAGDADLLVGYASLLEKTDKEKAIITYQRAIAVDSTNAIALFNIGALYYAKGKDLFETAQKTDDNKQYDLLAEGAGNYFKQARPYFERALAADPGSAETIQALKTIAFVLDDQEDYLKYQQMEGAPGK
jgi:tetratricopeptide (TPR) repeat protein